MSANNSCSTECACQGGFWSKGWLVVAIIFVACFSLALWYRDTLVTGYFGPPHVLMAEEFKENSDSPDFDHTEFDALLARHVDLDGRVDYQALAKDAKALDEYLDALAKAELDTLGRSQRLAFLINAYNACTLRLILDYYPLKSIKDIPEDKRWDDKRWNIGGMKLSLNELEHEHIRTMFKEPRIHFALVCAANGCPPLRNEAYTASRLYEQLDAQCQFVHSHDTWLQFDAKHNTLKLTSLYDWYRTDFEQTAESIVDFAARYSKPVSDALSSGQSVKPQFMDYDWSLNEKEADGRNK